MVAGESNNWWTVRKWDVEQGKFHPALENFYVWNFPGKGNRWPCWNCKRYHRQLLSKKDDLNTDNSYGITQHCKTGDTWVPFQWKWYCVDCCAAVGYIW